MKKLIYLTFLFLAVNLCFPSIASAQVFSDDFESGNFNQWTTGSSSMTYSVVSSPAIDNYSLQISGSSGNHEPGLRTTIPNTDTTIEEISWMVRTNSNNGGSAYVLFLDSNFSSLTDCMFWFYISYGNLRFYANSSNAYNYSCTLNTWYKIDIKNINWNSRTFDIYVDDVLRVSSFPFRGSLSKANTFVLYNWARTNDTANYDNFSVNGGTSGPLCVNTFSTSITQPSSGQSNGSIDLSCDNGDAPLRYARWSKRTGENFVEEDELDLNNADAGTYYLTLITLDNCIEYLGPYRLGN